MEHKIVDFAIQLAVILFAISFHESAHAYAALRFGDTTARDLGRISLNPIRHLDPFGSVILPILLYFLSAGRFIFGAAKPTPVDLRNTRNPRLANLIVSAAGPVSNFFLASLAIVLLVLIRTSSPQSISDLLDALQGNRFASGALAPVTYVLFRFAMVNVALAVFNLIPIPPLDGSGVILSVFGAPVARIYATIAPFGFLILILLISTPFLGWLFTPFQRLVLRLVFGG
ncbi:MAG TPA: site-2 protease family protein [Thermoanaerobaculia bacterium]